MMTMQQRILIADDEETFRESTSAILADAGYACSSARGRGGGRASLENSFDLLLADVRMPGNAQLELRRWWPNAIRICRWLWSGYPDGGDGDRIVSPFDRGLFDQAGRFGWNWKRAVERGLRRGIPHASR